MCYGEDKMVDVAFRGLAWTLDGMRFLALFKDSGPPELCQICPNAASLRTPAHPRSKGRSLEQ